MPPQLAVMHWLLLVLVVEEFIGLHIERMGWAMARPLLHWRLLRGSQIRDGWAVEDFSELIKT